MWKVHRALTYWTNSIVRPVVAGSEYHLCIMPDKAQQLMLDPATLLADTKSACASSAAELWRYVHRKQINRGT